MGSERRPGILAAYLVNAITHGKSVESYFRPGGKNAPDGPASVFLTYKMAEGINLQSADTLVLLGAHALAVWAANGGAGARSPVSR